MSEGFRLGVVYESGLLGSSHGGMGRVFGVTRDCSFSKWVCSVCKLVWGYDVIFPVLESVMVDRLGWSLASGCRPAAVFYYGGIFWGSICIVKLSFSVWSP